MKEKLRYSDYFKFLSKFSTMSIVIPSIVVFAVAGMRDSAYSPYFEEELGLSTETIGYIFIANSVSYFITGPTVGVLVEMGYGSFVGLFSVLAAPFLVFGLYLPKFFPALRSVLWYLVMLFANGFTIATMLNPTCLVLEKTAIRQGFTNVEQVKMLVASSYNLCTSSGLSFGAFVIGGYINDHIGFYEMSLVFAVLLFLTSIWYTIFLVKNNLVGKVFYDSNANQSSAELNDIRMQTKTAGEVSSVESGTCIDDVKTSSIASMFISSMTRTQAIAP